MSTFANLPAKERELYFRQYQQLRGIDPSIVPKISPFVIVRRAITLILQHYGCTSQQRKRISVLICYSACVSTKHGSFLPAGRAMRRLFLAVYVLFHPRIAWMRCAPITQQWNKCS
ncbi:hypothetical protein AW736_12130 [Termitidicoccus mucosus]|uniref:Uncharacterized protein n=1 Tax=Termitidicoccus mucosus TaxID=1184151 RepID=A0A178IJ01_9BACT|nr:hypothetical protein AW736_12130 [Opitutaceae bacterium TSB47]